MQNRDKEGKCQKVNRFSYLYVQESFIYVKKKKKKRKKKKEIE